MESPDEPLPGLRLFDLNGRVLDDVQFFRQYPVREYRLSLAGQPPGVYVLSVRTDKGWVGRKVVKQ
ncbi:MAG: T9SS type A sorting domain-containing protein [Lewinellaceae bacterium]|nr:T9SS type A sorting domain-containing protein [Lewinellaceae bacterium]